MNVLQEQSVLLYVIAGLLVVLIVIGIGVWMRLGDLVKAGQAPKAESRYEASWREQAKAPAAMVKSGGAVHYTEHTKTPTMSERLAEADRASQPTGAVTRACYGGKPPSDIEQRGGER